MATKEQLAKIIKGRAAALCSSAGDRMIDSHSKRINEAEQRQTYTDIPKPDYNYDTGYELSGGVSQRNRDIEYTSENAGYSRMPDAIKQSMLENRIDVSSLGAVGETDFLNEIATKNQQIIRRNQEVQAQSSTAIDYGLIKSIVMECLRETNQTMLNENSSLRQIRLVNGTIKLVDNSGNVYSAKLEKTGNINDKKK